MQEVLALKPSVLQIPFWKVVTSSAQETGIDSIER